MEKPREEVARIGNGSLHIITSVEEKNRSEGRILWTDTKLLWFKIAHVKSRMFGIYILRDFFYIPFVSFKSRSILKRN
jgi:hypothetical protein